MRPPRARRSFYARVLADLDLAPFFEGIDHERLHDKMAVVFEVAFGGRELAQVSRGSCWATPPLGGGGGEAGRGCWRALRNASWREGVPGS